MPSPPPPRHIVRRQQINVSTVNVFFSFSFLSFFFLPRAVRPYSIVMTDQTICLRRVLFSRNPFMLNFTNMCLYVCAFFINTHLSVYSITPRPSPRVCIYNNIVYVCTQQSAQPEAVGH